jgi:hypothetical protein
LAKRGRAPFFKKEIKLKPKDVFSFEKGKMKD